MPLADHAADVDLGQRRLRKIDIQIRTIVKAVIEVAVIIIQRIKLLEKTVLKQITDRSEVTDTVGTSRDIDVVLRLHVGVPEHQFAPVRVGEDHRIGAGFVGIQRIVREAGLGAVVTVEFLVVEQGRGITVGILDQHRRHLHADIARYGDLGFTLVSPSGGDQNDSVGTTDSEDGRRGGILQNGDVGNFIGVELRKRALDTVDQYQWRSISRTEGRTSPDVQRSILHTGLSDRLYGRDARHGSGQRIGHTGVGDLHQIFGLDAGHGSCYRDSRLGTISDHLYGFKHLRVGFERHLDIGPLVDGHLDLRITE